MACVSATHSNRYPWQFSESLIMIDIPINKKRLNSNRSRIIAVIKNEPGILTRSIMARLPDLTKRKIENALSALQCKKSITRTGETGLPGHWYVLRDPYSVTKEVFAPPPKKMSPAGDNLAPGILINKMAGTYTPSRAAPMRPGADDHMQHRSLRGDMRVEHRAPLGMQSTPRHVGSRVADDLNFILKQAQEKQK